MSNFLFDDEIKPNLPLASKQQDTKQKTNFPKKEQVTDNLRIPLFQHDKSFFYKQRPDTVTPKTVTPKTTLPTQSDESPIKTPFNKQTMKMWFDDNDFIREEEEHQNSPDQDDLEPKMKMSLFRRINSWDDKQEESPKQFVGRKLSTKKRNTTIAKSSDSNSNSPSANSDQKEESKEQQLPTTQKQLDDTDLNYIKKLWNSPTSPKKESHSPPKQISQDYQLFMIQQQQPQQILTQPIQSQTQSYFPMQLCWDMNQLSINSQPFTQFNQQPYVEDDIYLGNQIDNLWANQLVSRKLQKIIECGNEEQKEIIVSKLERISPYIEKDVFGNYVVQKIFDRGSEHHKLRMFNRLKPYLYDLSKNNFGCRVVQKIIEFSTTNEELANIVRINLFENMKSLIFDTNGNYVIFKMLEVYSPQKLSNLIGYLEESFVYMCSQVYGCKIILKVLETFNQEQCKNLMGFSVYNLNTLIQSEFGNYILQYILKNGNEVERLALVNQFLVQFTAFSMSKYASNTMEKVLEFLNPEQIQLVTGWLLYGRADSQQEEFLYSIVNPSIWQLCGQKVHRIEQLKFSCLNYGIFRNESI